MMIEETSNFENVIYTDIVDQSNEDDGFKMNIKPVNEIYDSLEVESPDFLTV